MVQHLLSFWIRKVDFTSAPSLQDSFPWQQLCNSSTMISTFLWSHLVLCCLFQAAEWVPVPIYCMSCYQEAWACRSCWQALDWKMGFLYPCCPSSHVRPHILEGCACTFECKWQSTSHSACKKCHTFSLNQSSSGCSSWSCTWHSRALVLRCLD